MTAQLQPLRPVQLQANTNGAWKTVLQFDAGNAAAAERVRQGAQMLHEACSGRSAFRIATCDRHPLVLSHMGGSTYGLWIDAALEGQNDARPA